MKRLLEYLGLVFLLAACGEAVEPEARAATEPPGEAAPGRRLVRTAELVLIVEDPGESREAVERVVAAHDGYVERAEFEGLASRASGRLVVRVPATSLDPVLAEFRDLAVEVERELSEVRDVTGRSIDLEARRTALAATEAELRALLGESREQGSGVDAILAVHRELTTILTQIEEIDGERKALAGAVEFARIELTLRTEEGADALSGSFAPGTFAGVCLGILVTVLKALGYALIFVVIVLVPVALIVGLPIVLLVWRGRRRRRVATPPIA